MTLDTGKDQHLVNLTPPRPPGKPPCGIKSPAGINRAQHDMRLFLHGHRRVYYLHFNCRVWNTYLKAFIFVPAKRTLLVMLD